MNGNSVKSVVKTNETELFNITVINFECFSRIVLYTPHNSLAFCIIRPINGFCVYQNIDFQLIQTNLTEMNLMTKKIHLNIKKNILIQNG